MRKRKLSATNPSTQTRIRKPGIRRVWLSAQTTKQGFAKLKLSVIYSSEIVAEDLANLLLDQVSMQPQEQRSGVIVKGFSAVSSRTNTSKLGLSKSPASRSISSFTIA